MPRSTADVTPSKTYGRGNGRGRRPAPNNRGRAGSETCAQQHGTGGVGGPRPTRWYGRGRRSSRNKIAGIIGTFGLTVKLGSAIFEFLFSTVPKSTKSIGGAPEGRQWAPLLGRRVSPSVAEFTVVEPD